MAYNWTGASKINWFPNLPKDGSVGSSILASAPTTPFMGYAGAQGSPGGGGNPYAGLLDQYFNQAKQQFAGQSVQDAASRDAAIKRAIISYGKVPDFAQMGGISGDLQGVLKGLLSQQVIDLANKNTTEGTSVFARQEHANDLANRRIPAVLAGRGMLHSGQTGSDLSEQALGHKIEGFDTLNQLLGSIEGAQSNFLQAERARQQQLAELEMQRAMAAMQNNAGGVGSADPTSGGAPAPPGSAAAAQQAQWRGYFGTIPQTRRVLNNRLKSGRM